MFLGGNISIAIKDSSNPIIENNTMKGNSVVIAAYLKNWRYGGGGRGKLINNDFCNNDILFDVDETSKISQNFYQQESREIKNIVIAGGSSAMPGLSDYLAENLKKTIEIANPFAGIFYPPLIEETLKQIGPSYAIAVGMAMRGLE